MTISVYISVQRVKCVARYSNEMTVPPEDMGDEEHERRDREEEDRRQVAEEAQRRVEEWIEQMDRADSDDEDTK